MFMQEELHELHALMISIEEEGELPGGASQKAVTLKKNFLHHFLDKQSSKAAGWLVCITQRAIGIWLNELYEMRLKRRKKNQVLEEIEIKMASFIDFLYRRFGNYFNLHETMPYSIWEQREEELEALWKRFLNQHQASVDPSIITLIYSVYRQCLAEHNAPTYHEYECFKRLWRILPGDMPAIATDTNELIIQTLIRQNLNNPDVVAYILLRLGQLMETSSHTPVFWLEQFRYFNQLPQVARTRLLQGHPSCKKQLLIAIRKELLISEQMQKQSNLLGAEQEVHGSIETDLSSGQLALLTRLKIETGVYKTDNITETLKKVGQQYLNRQKERISAETLRTKYYSPDTASIKIIHTRLLTMVARLKQV